MSEGEAVSQTKREEKRRAARERKDAIQQQELSIEREREQAAFKALQESRQKGIMGRPSSYTDERADELCTWIAQGNSLRSFCKLHGMEAQTVYRWMRERPDFQQRYARAHEDRADSLHIQHLPRCATQFLQFDQAGNKDVRHRSATTADIAGDVVSFYQYSLKYPKP